MLLLRRILTILFLCTLAAAQVSDDALLKELKWRNLGPANFSGRLVDIEALDADWTHVWVASASGGVWKSDNAGNTWTPIFDNYATASIGDIAVYQRDPNILWVGTGEANNRNSVGWGDGIYKSTDGGKTFANAGLKNTYQIARVVTHPTSPEIAYVAAIGNLWGYDGDRGLFKTIDGGKTWTKLAGGLPADEKTGATDLVMDPTNPEVLYVAFYQRLRLPFRFDSGGPNGGIWKSTNGGKTWTKLTNGLPTGPLGRIGLAVYRKNPQIVMAILEHGFQPREDDPAYKDMTKLGSGVYRSEDGGKTWKFLNRFNHRPFYYSQIRINPVDDKRVYVLTTNFMLSDDGGRTFKPAPPSYEGGLDNHAMWLDPTNRDRFYVGKDKGLTLTHDHGASFHYYENLPVGQFYAIGVDMRDPYYVYGGTQDNGSWGGPVFSRDNRGVLSDSWWKLHWGDGMFAQVDPTDWRKVYTEAENGSFRRYDAATHEVEFTRPTRQNTVNYADFVKQGTDFARAFRFNWRSPMLMSPHNPNTLYLGGNYLFRTLDGGRHWQIISPELSNIVPEKCMPEKTGGLTLDQTGAETHCTVVAISESPLRPGLIWVGTDDGELAVTRDAGVTWTKVRANVPDVPQGLWVSSVETSHFDPAVAYVTFDGHRSSNFQTWIYKTADFGKTWTSLAANLPAEQAMLVVKEDLKNRNLLFAGSEFALFATLNGGQSWTRMAIPTVAIQDLVIHPRDGDLLAATHGRGFYVLDDITPLQQLTGDVLKQPAYLFTQRAATIWQDQSRGGVRGHAYWAAPNPPYIPVPRDQAREMLHSGALINYFVGTAATGATLEISDLTGQHRRVLKVAGEPGIHRVLWNLEFDAAPEMRAKFIERLKKALDRIEQQTDITDQQRASIVPLRAELEKAQSDEELNAVRRKIFQFGRSRETRAAIGDALDAQQAAPGEYLLKLNAGGKTYSQTLTVRPDPNFDPKYKFVDRSLSGPEPDDD